MPFCSFPFWRADLDPIYFCELLTVCPIFDNGDATITSLTVKPGQGPVGKLKPVNTSVTITNNLPHNVTFRLQTWNYNAPKTIN
jgi:hypothetical protein